MKHWAQLALRALGSAAIGAVVLIAVGQVFAATRSTCDTLCRPEYAAVYGALGGLFFIVLWERTQPRPEEVDRSEP